ncbi:MAG: mannitol dehydrogenase family protein [Treponema sp.]|jgi:mannitol-1-phosphate/altronate dehydrogenase|nr:mannitol dehydrogenase family protein [Treponema sp.]
MGALRLNQKNLAALPKEVEIPRYDRGALIPRIVHLGLGHFHRAHQALYLDELISRGLTDAGIFEINLVEDPYPLEEIAGAQDYLYTLISRGAGGEEKLRVIGSILGYLNAGNGGAEKALARLAAAETSVISLTVTEKGYCFDMASGEPAWDLPPLRRDLENPGEPVTMPGFISAALALRSRTNGLPLTIMSCDNFPSNGRVLKTCVVSYCRKVYPDLVPWIEENAAFPLSMVDRITPATAPETIRYLADRFGIDDRWPVCCEDFRQWVLEDRFRIPEGPAGRAAFSPADLSHTGVQVVTEVEPYELMKIRLLNGSHSALSYPAYLLGHRGVAEAAIDPLVGNYIRRQYMEEITATLPPVEGIDLNVYKDTLLSRFSNKNIGDTVLRLAQDGSKKIPISVLNPLIEAIKGGLAHRAVTLALAFWARFLDGRDEAGAPIPLDDPNGAAATAAAKGARQDPASFLRVIGVHDIGIAAFRELETEFGEDLEKIYRLGTKKTLEEFC